MKTYNNQFKIPILLLTSKRERKVKLIINTLRNINASNVYINADGLKLISSKKNERDKIIRTRNTILENMNWQCKVRLKFNNKKLGYRNSTIDSVNWFFDNEESGIIIDENCVPKESFFYFCAELLKKYKNNQHIGCIIGLNLKKGQQVTQSSYYFSKYNNCLAWATWKKSWDLFDKDISFWPNMKSQKNWGIDSAICEEEKKYWGKIFESYYQNEIDSWVYPWLASMWYKNKLTIFPKYNLISKIGINGLVNHERNLVSIPSYINACNKEIVIDNPITKVSRETDKYIFKNYFYKKTDLKIKDKYSKKSKLLKKIFTKLKGIFINNL